jgi:hypothetical protein
MIVIEFPVSLAAVGTDLSLSPSDNDDETSMIFGG